MSRSIDEEEQAIARPFRLRAPPEPVTRLSRKTLAVSGAALGVGLAGGP